MIDPDYQSSEGHIKVVFTSDHILNRGVGFKAEFSVGMLPVFLFTLNLVNSKYTGKDF